ncbi:G-type lectin S-receptor-like serine/threonine-protein kinase [Forsythia ovata]|uniref:G-type lectin S-receptor-like serine/threonine-protein kinase n=1 Tax=Forsythia ovata TaxID=205694 RepID=A0ABD1S3A4_9LAMI
MDSYFIFKISYVENDDEVTITDSIKDPSIFSRLVVNESGTLERYTWQESERRWARFWSPVPTDQCDSYAHCGASGNCNLYNLSEFECSCLQGFEPKIERQWYLRDASRGCKRKQGENICGNGDGFNKVTNVKVPDTSIARVNKSLQLRECHDLCLKNCSCTAFASANISGGENGCLTWHGDLVDIRQFSNKGQDLYLRVPAVELAKYTRNSRGFRGKRLATTVIVSILAMLLIIFLSCWLLKKKRKGTEGLRKPLYSFSTGLTSYGNRGEERDGSGTSAEVSIFDLSTIVSATEDFSLANKLGEGGFGAVYKVWDLWKEDRALDIVDSSLDNSYEEANKVLRCIHVGLLCVQEYAPHRPTMSEVIFMLCNETTLPYPKQPAFVFKKASNTPYSSSASVENRSVNDMSITVVEAR